MRRYWLITVVSVLTGVLAAGANAETVNWNVGSKFGMSSQGIRQAIHEAKTHFSQTPDDVVILEFDEGSFYLENSKTDPQLVQEDNEQIPWTRAKHLEGRMWEIELKRKNQLASYAKGALIGIKSKHGGETEFGGQTYWFLGGSDFVFDSVQWTQKTRGVFRGGFNNVQFLNCVTDRSPPINGQTPCLASPGGGSQIGQPNDPPTTGNVVKNCRFIASGDDAVAFFNASGVISDCYIRDAFCRGILAANSPDAVLENNTVIRCPVQKSQDWRFHKTKPLGSTPSSTGTLARMWTMSAWRSCLAIKTRQFCWTE